MIDAGKDSEEHPACCRLGTDREKEVDVELDLPGDRYTIRKKIVGQVDPSAFWCLLAARITGKSGPVTVTY